MADPVFHNGADGKATVGATELAITKWDLTIKSNNKDVSNTVSGRKRIAGVPDAEGSLTMHWDSENQPTDSGGPNIRAGTILDLLLITDGSTGGFGLSAIVDEVHPSSEFEGTIDFDCKFSLEDGSTLVYPT